MKAYGLMRKSMFLKYMIYCIFLFAIVFATIFFGQDMSVNAEEVSFDIGKKSLECNNSSKVYDVYGSTKKNHIKVNGGTANKPIIVNLRNGLNIDLRNTNAAPIEITKNSHAKIYIGKGDSSAKINLYGGHESGIGKNWGYAGINCHEKSNVLISGDGSLNVYGGGEQYGGAGIGGNYSNNAGNLVIDGNMSINANGAHSAPGIGSGRDGVLYNLTINNGTITARGGKYAPGIGAGDAIASGSGGDLHNLTINGGTIVSYGGEHAAGIGCSEGGDLEGIIAIYGGNIKAYGGEHAAGIGGGNGGNIIKNGKINIECKQDKPMNIVANGGINGAGIGGGYEQPSCEIMIKGYPNKRELLNITAKASSGGNKVNSAAAIGSGQDEAGNISIKDATIHAYAQYAGADIGSGLCKGKHEKIDSITIDNCIIEAKGTDKVAAGIGAGGEGIIDHIKIRNSIYDGNSIGTSINATQDFNTTLTKAGHLNDMEDIIIEDSKIVCNHDRIMAKDRTVMRSGTAGIGTSSFGDINLIEIKRSTVLTSGHNTGPGIGSGGFGSTRGIWNYSGGNAKKILIEDSNITSSAGKSGAGAGIGSGLDCDVEEIIITRSNIKSNARGSSTSEGGAGIGAGRAGSVGNIKITNCPSVEAVGGPGSSGIGCGGHDTLVTTTLGTKCGPIVLSANTPDYKITAVGGDKAAGIGTGLGGQFKGKTEDGNSIVIDGYSIDAYGGYGGAGIGAGANGGGGRGADSKGILIKGKGVINANGGEGAAGIGGGLDGASDRVVISLEADVSKTKGVLRAKGGLGGAGIGSGSIVYTDQTIMTPGGHSAGTVKITGGYIEAFGGNNRHSERKDGRFLGSGAGIGGGSGHGTLSKLSVTGGCISAHAGNSDAMDIGYGGDFKGLKRVKSDGKIEISGGTVLSDKMSDEAKVIIDGGSISANISGVKNSIKENVYRTTLTLIKPSSKSVDVSTYGQSRVYGSNDIFSDKNGKIYMYLPSSEFMKTVVKADPTGYGGNAYYGTVTVDGNSLLKTYGVKSFKKPDPEPYFGGDFTLSVDTGDDTVSGCDFKVAEGENVVEIIEADSGNASVKLKTKTVGKFEIDAELKADPADEIYWGYNAKYSGIISRQKGKISFTENPSKIYDGEKVNNPKVTTNSNGGITYKYSTSGWISLDDAPVNVGRYHVTATVGDTNYYTSAKESLEFSIEPASTCTSLSAKQDGTAATITAVVTGLYEADGVVNFIINGKASEEYKVPVSFNETSGMYEAVLKANTVSSGEYTVDAEFIPGSNNYLSSKTSASYSKEKADRSISCPAVYEASYKDTKLKIEPKITEGASTPNDIWQYQIIKDKLTNYGFLSTANIDSSGEVGINNAGIVVVKITLTDSKGVYNNTETYTTIKVKRVPLKVSSYAYDKDGKEVTKTSYGSISDLNFGLKYDGFVRGEDKDNFTNGHGSLVTARLSDAVEVGKHNIRINRQGAPLETDKVHFDNIFVSRNYKIEEDSGTLEVLPREITVKADNVNGIYGVEPEYSYTIDGIASFDNVENAIENGAKVVLDDKKAVGGYTKLAPGKYENILLPPDKATKNYKIVKRNLGDLTIAPADFKDFGRFKVIGPKFTTYNGKEQKQKIIVKDLYFNTSNNKKTNKGEVLKEHVDYELKYIGDLINTGQVDVVVKGIGKYKGELHKSYLIKKAPLMVDTLDAEKIYDGNPLTASGTLKGLMNGETAEIVMIGSQTEVGSSPNKASVNWNGSADARNYDIEENFGTLTVHKKTPSITPDEPGKDDGFDNDSHDDANIPEKPAEKPQTKPTSTNTGDGQMIELYIGLVVASGIGLILCRRKQNHIK